eukprot:s574_g2.t2
MSRRCGSAGFVAPEAGLPAIRCKDCKVDTFGAGVILFFLLSKELPFSSPDRDSAATMRKTVKTLGWLICKSQEERLSAEAALEHSWIVRKAEKAALGSTKKDRVAEEGGDLGPDPESYTGLNGMNVRKEETSDEHHHSHRCQVIRDKSGRKKHPENSSAEVPGPLQTEADVTSPADSKDLSAAALLRSAFHQCSLMLHGGKGRIFPASPHAGSALGVCPSHSSDEEATRAKGKGTAEQIRSPVDDAEKEVKTIAKTGKQVVGDIEEDGIKVVGDIEEDGIKAVKALPNITKKAVKALPNITKKAGALLREGERSADKEEASDAAREGAIEVVKGLAFKPNTLTTTVAPTRLQPAPPPLSFQHFFSVAKSKLWHSLLYWFQPVVMELFLVSFAFVAFEITMGLGRHTTRYHRGQYQGKLGLLQAFSALCIDVWSSWVFGLGVLLAFWVVGILFSKELEFLALRIQAVPAHLAVPVLGILCAALSLYYVVRSFGCLSEGPKDSGSQVLIAKDLSAAQVSPRGSEADTLLPGRPEEFRTSRSMEISLMDEDSGQNSGVAVGLLRSVVSVLVALFVTALAAIEGPIISAALGSSWKAALMSSWSWGLLPWGEILPKVWGHKLTLVGLLALVAAGGCLIGCVLSFLRHHFGSNNCVLIEDQCSSNIVVIGGRGLS